ncbi:hypothetical protein ABZO31_22235 [Streptomyces sp. HUAS MG47]|uniref:hypothetical protein n=1 Tax=Streptomyces solicamelliae TaxID=3231716 RepID=UPI00387826A6
MASQRKLRTGVAAVCAVVTVGGVGGCSQFDLVRADADAVPVAVAPTPSPSPDPFKGLSADEIAERAVDATTSAKSLRMTGRVSAEGQPVNVDFSVNDRAECTGRLTVEGGIAEVRQKDKVAYMKGDEKFWRVSMTAQGLPPAQIEATLELLKGRWVKFAAGQPGSAELAGVCDLEALLADLEQDEAARTGMTRAKDGRIGSTPTATLVKQKADAGGSPHGRSPRGSTTVSVAMKGKPYILRIVRTGGEDPGTIRFSAFDKPVKVVTPPADETIDLSRLTPAAPPTAA